MAERQVGLRIMLEHQHFLQIAPINESDARLLMEQWHAAAPEQVFSGHSFTEDGQPWKYIFRAGRVVGMHTFSLEPKQAQAFAPSLPKAGNLPLSFGRS